MAKGYSISWISPRYRKWWTDRENAYAYKAIGTNNPQSVESLGNFISVGIIHQGARTRLWAFQFLADRNNFMKTTEGAVALDD